MTQRSFMSQEPVSPKGTDGSITCGLNQLSICSSTDKELHRKPSFTEKTQVGDVLDSTQHGIYVTCRKGDTQDKPNQDSWYVWRADDFSVYGVFDGHGKKGHDISNFVKERLPILIMQDRRFLTPTMPSGMQDAFRDMTTMLQTSMESGKVSAKFSGTTATVVVHDHRRKQLTMAYVGDSGAALVREKGLKAKYLTPDHKPDVPAELKRIRSHGGHVHFDGRQHRVYKVGESGPGLNMSRSFGDIQGRDAGIVSEPDISQISLKQTDEYLLVCSDGVWEFMEQDDAAAILHRFGDRGDKNPANELAFAALNRWNEHADVVDDITAVVVRLQDGLIPGSPGSVSPKTVRRQKSCLKRGKTGSTESEASMTSASSEGVDIAETSDAMSDYSVGLCWDTQLPMPHAKPASAKKHLEDGSEAELALKALEEAQGSVDIALSNPNLSVERGDGGSPISEVSGAAQLPQVQ